VLVVPREHIASLHELTATHAELSSALLLAAQRVAEQDGLVEHGYRVVSNVGDWGGQTVAHLHLHVLGGRPLKALG
jgi:histidine triad (HIT) family protein